MPHRTPAPTPSDRLKLARESARYGAAKEAALAMGVNYSTYAQHENGIRDISRDRLKRYSAFFRVSLEWLATGRGAMRAGPRDLTIPIDGVVGAGAGVVMTNGDEQTGDDIGLPQDGTIGALRMRGDSNWPRFYDGEIILYDRRETAPAALAGRMAIVEIDDGRRLIKTIRRGAEPNTWTLESHNAPPIENARVLRAWRYVGVIAP